MKLSTLLLASVAFTMSAPAQCNLNVIGPGTPGTTLFIDVTANPGDIAAVLISDQAGSLSFNTGFGTINLGVLQPWTVLDTGLIPLSGFDRNAFSLPAGLTPLSVFGQAIVLQAPFSPLQFCTSNVVAFSVG